MLFIAITTHSYNAVLCSVTVKDIKERRGNVRRMTLQFNELAIRDSLGNRKKKCKRAPSWTQMSKSANPNKRRTRGPITRTQIVVIPESTRIIKSKNRRKENNLLPDGSCRAVDLWSGLLGISVAFAKLSGCACPFGHHHHHHTTTAVPVPRSQFPMASISLWIREPGSPESRGSNWPSKAQLESQTST